MKSLAEHGSIKHPWFGPGNPWCEFPVVWIQPGMDGQKVFQGQYITAETLYMTYLRETNDVLKLTTPRQSSRKKLKFSGGFRGVGSLEPEVTESVEVDAVSDEIRRWSSLSEDECQCFVSAEDGILNEFEMM